MNCKFSELHVLSTNIAATNLYVRCGYIIKMKLPNHYNFNDKQHDALLLIKSLKGHKKNQSDIESDTESQNETESKSQNDTQGRERSPPYFQPEVNVEFDDSMENEIINIPNDDATALPISNWIGHSVDSLWIKCVLL